MIYQIHIEIRHEKALVIVKESGERSGEAKCYTNLSSAYYSLSNYEKAIEYQEKALEIAKEIGD
jgi:tetratricopeptide (TPR) repeat protein